jgi:hypothetical protein
VVRLVPEAEVKLKMPIEPVPRTVRFVVDTLFAFTVVPVAVVKFTVGKDAYPDTVRLVLETDCRFDWPPTVSTPLA